MRLHVREIVTRVPNSQGLLTTSFEVPETVQGNCGRVLGGGDGENASNDHRHHSRNNKSRSSYVAG